MPKPPRISSALAKKHKGETAISLLDGKVIAFGENAIDALEKAKKVLKDIEDEDYMISRVHGKILAV